MNEISLDEATEIDGGNSLKDFLYGATCAMIWATPLGAAIDAVQYYLQKGCMYDFLN